MIKLEDILLAVSLVIKGNKTAVVFCPPKVTTKERVRATRKTDDQILITTGRLNYEERQFIRLCKKAKTNPKKFWLRNPRKKV